VLRHHLDELMQHNRQHVEQVHVVVDVSLGLDTATSSNNQHNEPSNQQHHILLVILVDARVTLMVEQPLIFKVLDDVLVFNAPITVNIELIFNVLLVIINLNDAPDFEHTHQQVLEEPDFDLLLDDDEQLIL
jgi:hypothetical protein